jgi:hypothetical protein
VVANINANIGQVARDLSEEIRFLERFQRGIGLQPFFHRGAARLLKLDPWATICLSRLRWRAAIDFDGNAIKYRSATMPTTLIPTKAAKTLTPVRLINECGASSADQATDNPSPERRRLLAAFAKPECHRNHA